jgi:hypothetical protein
VSPPARLHPDDLAAIGRELGRLVPVRDPLWTVDQVATTLNMKRSYVYEHKTELGCVECPAKKEGGRPTLRFRPERVLAFIDEHTLTGEPTAAPRKAPARRRRSPTHTPTGADLIPFERRGGGTQNRTEEE